MICLGVKRHLVSGHEISRLQHGLQLIMARYTRISTVDDVVTYTYRTQPHTIKRYTNALFDTERGRT